MKKYILIICSALSLTVLCGCTVNMNTPQKENTTSSNTSQTESETFENTTTPIADPVVNIDDLSSDKVVWGPGNITNHEKPTDPVSLQKTFGDYNAKWLLDDDKSICLTFDEGYENGFTPAILDTLNDKNVKAVFFVTYDFASQNKELIKRMIDEGHIVGNHTYRHYTMDEVNNSTAAEEVRVLHDYIKKEFGYTMSYFRFPKGEFSQKSLGIVSDLGYKSIFWSYAYADWDAQNQPNEAQALQGICESTHPGEIMLLHAVSETNANILGRVIDDIRQQGYEFTTDL